MIEATKIKTEPKREIPLYGKTPCERQMEWYRREKSIFFHFGINTFTNREWGDGTEDPQIFNPQKLDCRQWVRAIKEAGFTTAILTAKHHDGFCLWPSKYTEHSVKNSPYKDGKGDIVKEFTDACAEYGIKTGLYLSPWDRHEKTWGTEAYNDFYVNQIEELFNNYGKIWECWWDGAGSTEARYDFDRWVKTIKKYQPDAVIFGSLDATPHVDVRWVGNENGIAGKPCWATVDEIALRKEINSMLNSGETDGEMFAPAEVDVSIRPGWFYHPEQDKQVRTPENLLKLWFTSVGSNAGLLLNVPPNKDGLLSEADIQSITDFNKMLDESLENNLAEKASVEVNSAAEEEYSGRNVLNNDDNSFYTPKPECSTPEMIFTFDEKIEFNTFILSEMIEFGHKIRGFEISARVDNEWKTLCKGECVGYKCTEHFDVISTDAVKLKITDAVSAPQIRFFGLYRFDESYFKTEKMRFSHENILRNGVAVVERKGDCFEVDLGGVIPYNKIIFEGEKIRKYEIYIFDGTSFNLCKVGENKSTDKIICAFDEPIVSSYKFRINVTEKVCDLKHLKIEVYCN